MNEPVRILADWLGDATYGVEAQLADVPRDVGDSIPGGGTVTVYDETRDEEAAPGQFPDPGTGIVVTVGFQGSTMGDDAAAWNNGHGAVRLLVRVGLRAANMANAKRDGNYVLRAVEWSLRLFRQQDPNASTHTRNSYRLTLLQEHEVVQWWEKVEDTLVTAALLVPFTAHDLGPS